MKKAIAIIVSLLFVLSLGGLSFAADEKEAAPAPEKKERHHAKHGMHVYGEVTAVDAAAKTLTVKGKKREVTLTIDDKTRFHKGKTLDDVKVGDKVSAKYKERDGKMVASGVKIKTARMKKEMKEEKKE